MYSCIKSFMDNDKENGLLLLDMPTGFGKTYSVIKYIAEFIKENSDTGKKIFFITTLKKNLPVEELKRRLDEMELLHLFEERVIELKSNVDTVVANYNSSMYNDIPLEIRNSEEFKNFKADVEFLKKHTGQNSDLVRSVRNNFSNNNERIFRSHLQNIFTRNFPSIKERLLAIKTDSAWQWVGKLYPSVFTSEKQVIFMSMDKFICPHSTIVEKGYYFYNSKISNGALVFIDEFDATKGTILKNIIENGLKEKIDYIELFNHIYAVLRNKTFPESLFVPSAHRMNSDYKDQSLKDVLKDLIKLADEIYDTYSLNFNHKTENAENDSANFLFNDHRYISVLSGQNKFISISSDENDSVNRITFSTRKPEEKNSIQMLLSKLRGFISYFQITVSILATNYVHLRNERSNNGDDEYTYDSAIRSVLAEFDLGTVYENYLFTQVKMLRTKSRNSIAGSDFDFSLYENGFRYYSFENSPDYDFKSIISMFSFSQTPERILTKLCEKAKVIGVSATATLPSVLCNYDLDYLSHKMGAAYSHISADDRERLKNEFANSQQGYKDIAVHAELFDSSNYSVSLWDQVFDDSELAKAAYDHVERSLSSADGGEDNKYNHQRYFRIALAFKKFWEHEDIRSFLCMLNKHPKRNDKFLDINVLYYLFELITERLCDVRKTVCLLDGEGYDDKKSDIAKKLTNGEKLFVISVYQTIGAGQNLQYDIPDAVRDSLIQTNSWNRSTKKDFDAIYLDLPTNLTVNIWNDSHIGTEDFVKYIFETEYLQENGEISDEIARQNIKEAFGRSFCRKKFMGKTYKDKPSVCYYATKQIVQAIGRICRTNMKQPDIYVFADADICNYFHVGIAENRLLNREVTALIDKINEHGAAEIPDPDLISHGELCSVRVNKFINSMIREEWDRNKMKQWEKLREIVLKTPTATKEDYQNFTISQSYIQMSEPADKYYYSQEEDYNRIKIRFAPSRDFPCEVSAKAAKLDRILLFSGMTEYFTAKGRALTFAPNEYIMSPALFNNIYKGALGEAAGWVWFRNVLGIQLDMIREPALFELFDYKVPGLPVYVDFKNWHDTTRFDEKGTMNKVVRKARECRAECVIIANILADGSYDTRVTHDGEITIVRCPSIMTDNGTTVTENVEAAEVIRRCINNVRNSHE